MDDLIEKQKQLMDHIPHKHLVKPDHQGSVVSALGIIEETMEYLNSIGFKSWRPNPLPRQNQLEKLTDILFFYLELVIMSEFSWPEVVQEYHRKWEVNMDRYKRAREGDFSWDKRIEGGL